MKNKIQYNLISFLVCITIIFSACGYVFADSPEDSTPSGDVQYPESALLSTVEDADVIAYDNMLREVAYQTALRSTGDYNYDAGDIYNLLWQTLVGNGSYYVKVYDNNVYNLYDALIVSGLINDLASDIDSIESQLSGNTGYAVGDIWNFLYQIRNALTIDTNSNVPGDYTIHHNVDLISQFLASGLFDGQQNPFLQGISGNLTTVSANLASQMNQIIVIRNKIDSIDSNVDFIEDYTSYICEATEQVIVPRIEHIDDDLHSISNLLRDTFYYHELTETRQNLQYRMERNASIAEYPCNISDSGFSNFQYDVMTPVLETGNIVNVHFPIPDYINLVFNSSDITSVRVWRFNDDPVLGNRPSYSGKKSYNYITNIDYVNNEIVVTYDLRNLDYKYYAICILSPDMYSISPSSNTYSDYYAYVPYSVEVDINYIEHISNNIDHMDNDLHSIGDTLDVFKELYASDDIIASKEAQQPLEDQILEDFTGSGSASASVGEAVSVKNISTTVKGGLDMGYTITDGLNIFNQNNALWSFFTQENYDTINTICVNGNTHIASESGGRRGLSEYDQHLIDIQNSMRVGEYYD